MIWHALVLVCAQVEFIVVERKLPPIESFTLRVDSSLGEGVSLPDEAAKVIISSLLRIDFTEAPKMYAKVDPSNLTCQGSRTV